LTAMGQEISAAGAAQPMAPAAPPLAPPHAPMPPVTGSVPMVPPGGAPAGGLSSATVGRGRYVIDHLVGRGGMSAVYVARDTHVSGRLVAVKEMVDQFADPQERLAAERDFAREADLLATLRHPAIPAIYDRFSENSRHLLVMEYIAGENLEQMLATRGPIDEDQVRAWASEMCSVLAYLHAQRPPVVFRDLKPGNIIVQPDGRVRLIDFGIARLFKPQQKADTTALGTSGYASPEHYTGQTDARSDIYSLGATMHHLLTGRDPSRFPPFQFPPVRDLNPAVSAEMAAIVERAVRTDREQRFATADEMREALERKRRRPKSATPPAATAPAPRAASNGAAAPAPSQPGRSLAVSVPPRQVLVLESFGAGKRINYDAVAAHVAAMTAGDVAALRAALQRGLPMTLPLAPGAQMAAHLQALAALQVQARVVTPATVPVLLDGELRRRLATTHQLVVRDVTVGQARLCHCRRCGYAWKTTKAPGEPVPLRCPNCRSPEWGRWRIFKCAWCGHEFDTADVHTRRPERLFPSCPCCGLANWESGRPPARTSWLDRLLAALAGTALLG
ncbi:MAG TPA: protein kinase, partial [Chloroflexota bacterium]|nr:protein kinase [Chloroflexota bacterium]